MNKNRFWSILFAIAMAAVALQGCGGSSSSNRTADPIPIDGGIPTRTVLTTEAIPASDQIQEVTIEGERIRLAPTRESLPPGTPLTVIPAGVPLINGLRSSTTRAPGDVYVGFYPGTLLPTPVTAMASNYATVLAFAFAPGDYQVMMQGPFTFWDPTRDHLTVQKLEYRFSVVRLDVPGSPVPVNIHSLPETFFGTLPLNGKSTKYDSAVGGPLVRVDTSALLGDISGSVTFISGNWQLRQRRKFVAPGTATAYALFSDNVGGQIVPNSGLEVVRFSKFFRPDRDDFGVTHYVEKELPE